MNNSIGWSIKKGFLYSLIASVLATAMMGIAAILSGDIGTLEIRVLLTTVTVSGASLCGLACGAVLESRPSRGMPGSGLALTIVAAAMIVLGIWIEPKSAAFWKLTATATIFAIACSHLALLSLARLPQTLFWVMAAAHVIVFGVAGLCAGMMWAETDDYFRLLGAAAILDAAITVVIPILHRLHRPLIGETATNAAVPGFAAIDAEIARLSARIEELRHVRDLATESLDGRESDLAAFNPPAAHRQDAVAGA